LERLTGPPAAVEGDEGAGRPREVCGQGRPVVSAPRRRPGLGDLDLPRHVVRVRRLPPRRQLRRRPRDRDRRQPAADVPAERSAQPRRVHRGHPAEGAGLNDPSVFASSPKTGLDPCREPTSCWMSESRSGISPTDWMPSTGCGIGMKTS